MKDKTNFFKKFITSIYDLKVFSDYAKEGLLSAILYALLITLILGGVKGAFTGYRLNNEISKIDQELKNDKYKLSIEKGVLSISESPVKFQGINSIIYIDDHISMNERDSLRSIIVHKDLSILILKDGLVVNNSMNEYKISYNDILKNSTFNGSELTKEIGTFKVISLMLTIITVIMITFIELLINCLIVVIFASLIAVFMRMAVRYSAMYSLTLYAATLPLIIKIILEIIDSSVDLNTVFIIGTLIYVVFILNYIKWDIIEKLNSKSAK